MVEQQPGSGETMRRMGLATGLAIGMGVGVSLGVALHNMGTGIAIGLVLGAAVMVLFTYVGTRMQREEQRRRAEADRVAETGPVAEAEGEPDQPAAGSGDGGV